MEWNLDPADYLEEIAGVENAWGEATGRQKKIKVQREALSIPLRGLRKSAIGERKRKDVHESRWTTGSAKYPKACAFLEIFAKKQKGLLGRAKIVCLPVGKRVYPHIDQGEYYRPRDRYHFVLRSTGSWMKSGDEEISMKEGELWWFDNDEVHEARNDGSEDRIHMIFDLLPEEKVDQVFSVAD